MHEQKKIIVSLLLLACIAQHAAAAPRKDLRSVDRDELESNDPVVRRSGIIASLDREYRLGQFGVLLPSYGRVPLYEAFRALKLGRAALAQQETDTSPPPPWKAEIDNVSVWLDQRRGNTDQPPAHKPSQYRKFGQGMFGSYLNCGDDAFRFAIRTLGDLRANTKLPAGAVRDWVAAQDAVFDQCGDPTDAAAPALPAEMPASAPLQLRQLRQYQVAAATFYAGNYAEAQRRFDAIAADKRHPLRPWASHAGLRALLRSASMDMSLDARLREVRSEPSPERRREMAVAAFQANERKNGLVYEQIAARVGTILADKTLAETHEAARKLLAQAAVMIAPDRAYAELSAALDRFDHDFQRSGELGNWGLLGDQLFDFGLRRNLITDLRGRYEYFDWIRTIQGCNDNPASPNFTGKCADEGAHALEKWTATKSRAWLLAALMTAGQPDARLEPALAAARQATPADMDYLSLRYYSVRLLRGAGRRDEAIALIDEVLAAPGRGVGGLGRGTAPSAGNLFRQERFALAKSDQEALPYVSRVAPGRLGADGDELLNRRLAAADLLRLAGNPAAEGELRNALLAAAWWRGELVGDNRTAEAAARALAESDARLRDATGAYLKASDAEERRYLLAKAGLELRISPVVFVRVPAISGRANGGIADWWCSFNSADFAPAARIQRIPMPQPELAADAARRDAEIAKLNGMGTAAEWLAGVALRRAKANPGDPDARRMLEAVVRSEKLDCAETDGGAALGEARRVLASMPRAPVVIGEAEVRARYEQIRRAIEGKTQYRASHILVASEAQAKEALAKINGGAAFESVAREVSIDRASGNKGGELGWSLPETYDPAFGDILRGFTAPGLYPQPVRTRFGWHLIKVDELRTVRMIPFEQARPRIEEELRKEQMK